MSQSVSRQLVNLLQTATATLVEIFELAMLEAKLAGKSLIILIGLFIAIIILLTSAWFCFLGIMFFSLISVGILWAFFITALINLLLIIPLLWIGRNYMQNFSFSATKRQLVIKKEQVHDSTKETNSTL